MPTWSDVQGFVRGHYRLQRDEPGYFVLGWQLSEEPDDKAAGGAALVAPPAIQTLHCQHLSAPAGEAGPAWLLLRAEVCGERALSPTAALQHSARLVLGGLVLSGNQYVLRYTLPLRSLDWGDFEHALQYIAREAGRLRQRISSQTGAPVRRPALSHAD